MFCVANDKKHRSYTVLPQHNPAPCSVVPHIPLCNHMALPHPASRRLWGAEGTRQNNCGPEKKKKNSSAWNELVSCDVRPCSPSASPAKSMKAVQWDTSA